FAWPVRKDATDVPAILGSDEEAFGFPRDVRELLASLADGWCVNQRQNSIDVLDHCLVEETLVALLQSRQEHISIDVARQALEVHHEPVDHLSVGRDTIGKEPGQAQAIPFGPAERDRSIERFVTEHVKA